MVIFQIIGAIGLICIIVGILLERNKRILRDEIYVLGGLLLLVYSISINDWIFIILQAVFVIVAIYDWIKNR